MKFFFSLLFVLSTAIPVFADDYIVIVFDTSNSMGTAMSKSKGSRMDVAKAALSSVLQTVPDTTNVGLVTFGGWAYDLGKVDKHSLQRAIANMGFTGGTPLYQYTKMGADRLLKERAKNNNVGSYKLLVVTDGEANSDDRPLNNDGRFPNGAVRLGVLKDIISRGIMVDAIGLEMASDHALKNQINGVYMRGDDADSIKKSLQKSVAEVGFDGKDNLSSFDVISELPEGFVQSALKGLTEFKNHPIGELPPPPPVVGAVDPVNANNISCQNSGGNSGSGNVAFVILGVVVAVVIVGTVIMKMGDC